jgi:hypothetical protein
LSREERDKYNEEALNSEIEIPNLLYITSKPMRNSKIKKFFDKWKDEVINYFIIIKIFDVN